MGAKVDTQRTITWAHSVLNDPGSREWMKRRAEAVLASLDPDELRDHDDDPIRSRGMFDD
jgi:hypothetical protein